MYFFETITLDLVEFNQKTISFSRITHLSVLADFGTTAWPNNVISNLNFACCL